MRELANQEEKYPMRVMLENNRVRLLFCILLAAALGFISVVYNHFEYTIFFDIVLWILVFGAVPLFRIWNIPKIKRNLNFWVGLFFTVMIASVITVWAPWAFDFFWESNRGVTSGTLWLVSGISTFGMFLFSTLGFLFPLRWSGLITFKRKSFFLILLCFLLAAASAIATFFCWLVVLKVNSTTSNPSWVLWLTEAIVCLSLLLVWFLVLDKGFFDVDGGKVDFVSASSEKDLSAIVLFLFPLVLTGIIAAAGYCNDNFLNGIFSESIFDLVIFSLSWFFCFYIFLSHNKDRRNYRWTQSSILISSLVMALLAWTRGGIGLLWEGLGNLSAFVQMPSFFSAATDFLVVLISLVFYTFVSLLVSCRLKHLNWKDEAKGRIGILCIQAFCLTLFLFAANEIVTRMYIESFYLSWALYRLPWALIYVFIFFSTYTHTHEKEK